MYCTRADLLDFCDHDKREQLLKESDESNDDDSDGDKDGSDGDEDGSDDELQSGIESAHICNDSWHMQMPAMTCRWRQRRVNALGA
jgi:hypothetical protein